MVCATKNGGKGQKAFLSCPSRKEAEKKVQIVGDVGEDGQTATGVKFRICPEGLQIVCEDGRVLTTDCSATGSQDALFNSSRPDIVIVDAHQSREQSSVWTLVPVEGHRSNESLFYVEMIVVVRA